MMPPRNVQSISVPKRWFTWFYVFAATLNIACCVSMHTLTQKQEDMGIAIHAIMLPGMLFSLHLCRRLLECLFVHRFSLEARMPLHLFAAGMLYYAAASVTLQPLDRILTALTDALQADDPARSPANYELHKCPARTTATDPRSTYVLWLGLALWLGGNVVQHGAHSYLAWLREPTHAAMQASAEPRAAPRRGRSASRKLSDDGVQLQRKTTQRDAHSLHTATYSLPTGYLFKLVHCPHYSAEVVLYMGLVLVRFWSTALSFWPAAAAVLLICWCIANLAATGMHTRRWYAKQFPEQREAIMSKAVLLPGVL